MIFVALIFLALAWLGAFFRSVMGPNLIDRAAGVDVMATATAALIVLLGLQNQGDRFFADIAILLIGAGFLAVVFLAKMHEKGQE